MLAGSNLHLSRKSREGPRIIHVGGVGGLDSSAEIWKPLGPGKGAATETQDTHDSLLLQDDLAFRDTARFGLCPAQVGLGPSSAKRALGTDTKVGAALVCPCPPGLTYMPLAAHMTRRKQQLPDSCRCLVGPRCYCS